MNNTINIVNTGHTPATESEINIAPASQFGSKTGRSSAVTESFSDSIQKAYSDSKQGETKNGFDSSGNKLPIFNQSTELPAKNGRPGSLIPRLSSGVNSAPTNVSHLSESSENQTITDIKNIDITESNHIIQLNGNTGTSENQKVILAQAGHPSALPINTHDIKHQTAHIRDSETDVQSVRHAIQNSVDQNPQSLSVNKIKQSGLISNIDSKIIQPVNVHTATAGGDISAINLEKINTKNQSVSDSTLNHELHANKIISQPDLTKTTTGNIENNITSIKKSQISPVESLAINSEQAELTADKNHLNQQSELASQADRMKYQPGASLGMADNNETITTGKENIMAKPFGNLATDVELEGLSTEKHQVAQHIELSTKIDLSKLKPENSRLIAGHSEVISPGKENKPGQFVGPMTLNTEKLEITTDKIHLMHRFEIEKNVDVRQIQSLDLRTAISNLETINTARDNSFIHYSNLTDMHTEQLDLMTGKSQLLPDTVKQQILPNIHNSLLSHVTPEPGVLNSGGIALTSTTLSNNVSSTNINSVPQGEITEAFGKPVWNQGMGKQILWMVNQNISSAEIRLNPANLGPIEVLIGMSEDDVSVSLSSRHAVVREAMEQALPRLREMLDENGFNLADTDISKHSFSEQREQNGEEKKDFLNGNNENIVSAEINEPKLYQASSTGVVDYYI